MSGIYIHIPFCRHKCSYCNFFSVASQKHRDKISRALIAELEQRKDYLSEAVETIYFGGGTPSLLAVSEVNEILKKLKTVFVVDSDAEITFEANPDDLNPDYLQGLKKAGINRISIGIQSFHASDLRYLERLHKAERIPQLIQDIKHAGFSSISADLIYGIPGQTEQMLKQNMKQLCSFEVDHISAYALTVEPGTALSWQIRKSKKQNVDEELSAEHFRLLSSFLKTQGYEHYEVSNFALPGRHSRHNTSYWYHRPYLGIGPSAHSFDGKSRRWNVHSVHKYISGAENKSIAYEQEELDHVQLFNEFVMLRLRTAEGINMQELARLFGPQWHNHLRKQAKAIKRPDLIRFQGNDIRLTDEGLLYADGLAAELFRE
jgi:oxygen-independent coproporphyrinogen-3 oxidase